MLKEVAEAIEETETISGKNLRSLNRFRLLFSLFTEPRGLKRLRPRVAPKLGCEETERRRKLGNERGPHRAEESACGRKRAPATFV
jgi:hypothetical protein